MQSTTSVRNEHLCAQLLQVLRQPNPRPAQIAPPRPQPKPVFSVHASPDATTDSQEPIDVVVTINEVNDKHGTGPLVKRIFKDRRNVFSIRTREDWGIQDFGDWTVTIPQGGSPRHECFRNVLSVLRGRNVRNVVCIPYLRDELI